ncbi:unnamed protein product [Caenorhabditis auriculariae]|uniref:Uncharacterized protein n=1 Tax=Caenorhabditis auriculariae TaxID=2777116 RepID=A0A8S1H3H9_9PELO|nr:unnamed protein product [Caenorhabditis auriculariae]
MMGPPRKMPSRPSASRISYNKAERSSSAPPINSDDENSAFLTQRGDDGFKLETEVDQLEGRLNKNRYQPNARKSS